MFYEILHRTVTMIFKCDTLSWLNAYLSGKLDLRGKQVRKVIKLIEIIKRN